MKTCQITGEFPVGSMLVILSEIYDLKVVAATAATTHSSSSSSNQDAFLYTQKPNNLVMLISPGMKALPALAGWKQPGKQKNIVSCQPWIQLSPLCVSSTFFSLFLPPPRPLTVHARLCGEELL